jgi:hypothetical protein
MRRVEMERVTMDGQEMKAAFREARNSPLWAGIKQVLQVMEDEELRTGGEPLASVQMKQESMVRVDELRQVRLQIEEMMEG